MIDTPENREGNLRDLEAHSAFEDFEFEWKRADGTQRILRSSGKPVFDIDGAFRGYRGAVKDVTDTHRMAQEIAYQASHDPLTGLVNRRRFEQSVQRLLESDGAEKQEHAVCYLDLDQFKVINDTCGYVAGDELLRQLAVLLSQQIRKGDILARLGGDEFGVLMEQCTTSQAQRVASVLLESIQNFHFGWDDKRFSLGASIGLAPVNESSDNVDAVLSAADSACYTAKFWERVVVIRLFEKFASRLSKD